MVVAEYKHGNTKVRIHDDCMAKTVEENDAILKRIEKMVTRQYQKEAMKAKERSA